MTRSFKFCCVLIALSFFLLCAAACRAQLPPLLPPDDGAATEAGAQTTTSSDTRTVDPEPADAQMAAPVQNAPSNQVDLNGNPVPLEPLPGTAPAKQQPALAKIAPERSPNT
jgi:hypothetical protein